METKKSTFISVLAWILIIISGFGLFIAIMQNVLINTFIPINEMQEAVKKDPAPVEFLNFLAINIRYVFLLFGLVILAFFISSIAFLKRKSWARVVMLFAFGFGIIYSIGAGIFQVFFMNRMIGFDDEFETMRSVMFVFTFIFVVGFIILFGWLIKMLTSKKIIGEFSK